DADHGINMDRGLGVAVSKIATLDGATPGQLLRTVGLTLISTVGGAAGPLYGTAFVEAGGVLGEDATFDAVQMLEALRASLAGIQRKGAAVEGDKTMVDAFAPALVAF